MMHDFDELDRALFALPLEAPPPGLRQAILAATSEAPALPSFTLRAWELAGISAALAVAVWFVLTLFADPSLAAQVATTSLAVIRALTDPRTFVWLAAGFSTALWLSMFNLTPILSAVRAGRS